MQMNIKLLNQTLADNTELDVVLLGDSITEMWNGRMRGNFIKKLDNNTAAFQKLFQRKHGSKIEGLALGIARDQVRS